MRDKELVITKAFFFYLGVILYTVGTTLSMSTIIYKVGDIPTIIIFISQVLAIVNLFDRNYKIYEIVLPIIYLPIFLICCKNAGANLILPTLVFAITGRNVDIKKALKIMISTSLGCTIFVLMFAILGFIESYEGIDGTLSMGFLNANMLGAKIIVFALGLIFFNYENFGRKHIFCILGLFLFVLFTSKSRTSMLILVLSIFIIFISKRLQTGTLYKITICSIITAPVLSWFTAVFVDDFLNLNEMFSGRIVSSNWFLKAYGLSMFGREINYYNKIDDVNYALDNAYFYIGVFFGIFVLVFFILGSLRIAHYARDCNEKGLLVILILVAIWGMTETCYFRIQYNYFSLFYIVYLYRYPFFRELSGRFRIKRAIQRTQE